MKKSYTKKVWALSLVGICSMVCAGCHEKDSNLDSIRFITEATIGTRAITPRTSVIPGDDVEKFIWVTGDAIAITLENTNHIGIYSGFNTFVSSNIQGNTATFSGSAEMTDWSPYFGQSVNVYAFYPASAVNAETTENIAYTIPTTQMQENNDYTHLGANDLMWAQVQAFELTVKRSDVYLPSLSFKHLVSLLRFRVKNGNSSHLAIKKVEMRASEQVFANGATEVNITESTPELAVVQTDVSTLTLTVADATPMPQNSEWNGYMTVIPVNLSGVLLDFAVTIEDENRIEKTFLTKQGLDIQQPLKPGFRYLFNLTVGQDLIVNLESVLPGWENETVLP